MANALVNTFTSLFSNVSKSRVRDGQTGSRPSEVLETNFIRFVRGQFKFALNSDFVILCWFHGPRIISAASNVVF